MKNLTIDLASKYSAHMVLSGGEVETQGDSIQWASDHEYAKAIAVLAAYASVDTVIIEDVPHHMRFDTVTKAVCRLQGRIIDQLEEAAWDGHLRSECLTPKILFLPPALWQREMKVWKQTDVFTARVAQELGYEPPNLIMDLIDTYVNLHGKERQDIRAALKKTMTDYVDAFLIGQWAERCWARHGTLDVPSTQRLAGRAMLHAV